MLFTLRILAFFCFAIQFELFSQAILDNTSFVQTATKQALDVYTKKLGNQNPFYIGVEYMPPSSNHQEFPFFATDDFENATVKINGVAYQNVPILYDIFNDKVITELGNTTIPIELISDRIFSFSFLGHPFIRIDNDTVNNTLPATSFYEVLYAGNSMVVLHHRKTPQTISENRIEKVIYLKKDLVFIKSGNAFYRINSKRDILRIFSSKKQELKSFISMNKLKFNTSTNQNIVRIAQYFDSISESSN